MNKANEIHKGGCLCGGVRYVVRGKLRDVVNCHCEMCQKQHGGFGPHSKALKKNISVTNSATLAWYQTSDVARRGFCKNCGSGLFWEPFDLDATGIIAGTLDDPSQLKTMGHIFVDEKSGFYEITDELPQFGESSDGALAGDYR